MDLRDKTDKKKRLYNKMVKQKKNNNSIPIPPLVKENNLNDVSEKLLKDLKETILSFKDELINISENISNLQKGQKKIEEKSNKIKKNYKELSIDVKTLNDTVESLIEENDCDYIDKINMDVETDEDYNIFEDQIKLYINSEIKKKNLSKQESLNQRNSTIQYYNLLDKNISKECLKYFINSNIENQKNIIEQEKNIKEFTKDEEEPIRYRIQKFNIPDNIKRKVYQKLEIYQNDSSNSAKFTSWINGFMEIPWNKISNLPVNKESPPNDICKFLKNAKNIMDNVIYGQNNAKEHILEVISKMISNPNKAGNVFCIHGEMGTGKTSIIKNGMAKALGLPFMFISLGGMQDSSHLVGHDYTYEGSTAGRIVEGLKSCKSMNPIIFFDELDKVSESNRGTEIINLLIHLTDSSQNNQFQDKYYSEIPFDLSKAIFVFSLNHIENVNPILKDRMHQIKMDKFSSEEKVIISRDYLLPELYKEYDISNSEIIFTDEIIRCMVGKTIEKEDGVRGIRKRLETVISKLNVVKWLIKRNSNIDNDTINNDTINNDTIDNDTINNDNEERPSKRRRIEKNIESKEDKTKKNKKNKKNTDKLNKVKINTPIEEIIETHDILKCIDIRDIKFPLTITQDLISKLLKKNVDKSDFPYYMYS